MNDCLHEMLITAVLTRRAANGTNKVVNNQGRAIFY